MSDITIADKIQRLLKIQELREDGYTESEIAKELGVSLNTISNNIRDLSKIALADISPEEKGKKRSELYLELMEAAAKVKILFDTNSSDKPLVARAYFKSWLETIELRMKLFGLDSPKAGAVVQVNQFAGGEVVKDTLPSNVGSKIADILKRHHEDSVNK
jgi:predicted transcriptional regulator